MNKLTIFAVAAAASLGLASPAAATDLYGTVTQSPSMYSQPGFDWEGFYFGVQKGVWIGEGFIFDGVAGVNFKLSDKVVGGVEAIGGVVTDFSTGSFEGYVRGRVGFLVGDDVLLYKVAELGIVSGTTTWGLGAGLEFAASDNMSVRGEVRGIGPLGSPLSDVAVTFGFLWHPQN